MRIGGALILIAAGAIMKWAITVKDSHGFNLNTIGLILMVVGVVWLLAEVIYMSTRRRTDVIHEGPGVPAQHTVYTEPRY